MEKTTRCTDCYTEFTDEEIATATSCPHCQSTAVPCAIAQDVELKVNWHELRVLANWASEWAMSGLDESLCHTLNCILDRLSTHRKPEWPAITLDREIEELKEQGIDCELTRPKMPPVITSPEITIHRGKDA